MASIGEMTVTVRMDDELRGRLDAINNRLDGYELVARERHVGSVMLREEYALAPKTVALATLAGSAVALAGAAMCSARQLSRRAFLRFRL